MTTDMQGFTPTDEDVRRAARALGGFSVYEDAESVLSTIGPIIERERLAAWDEGYAHAYAGLTVQRRAAKVEALREWARGAYPDARLDAETYAEEIERGDHG